MTQNVDALYGHVTLVDDSGHYATIIDGGATCLVHQGVGMYTTDGYTEEQARELGCALIGWAGRKRLKRLEQERPGALAAYLKVMDEHLTGGGES